MTLGEVKKGLLQAMQTVFTKAKYKYYSMSVVENYERPCFFTQLKVTSSEALNFNTRQLYGTLYIDHFAESVDESGALSMVQTLQNAFGLAVQAGYRYVYVEGLDYDFIGTERTHLQITVDLSWTDRIRHGNEDAPIMGAAKINKILED